LNNYFCTFEEKGEIIIGNKDLLDLEELHNVSIDEVLKGTGITSQQYNNYREGKEQISPEDALALSKFFKVPSSYFFRYNVHNVNSGPNSHSGPITTYNNHSNEGFYNIVVQLLLDKGVLKTDIKDMKKNDESGKN